MFSEGEEESEEELEEEEPKPSPKHKRDVFRDLSSVISSVFSETACGEPTQAQHLVIDFTPVEGVDTDQDRDKCFEFWKLVDKEPLLQAFIVGPEEDYLSGEMELEEEEEKEEACVEPEKTAIYVLNQATDLLKCSCSPQMCCLCNRKHSNAPAEYTGPALRKLCLQLHHWSFEHPKSFEPPGHPPEPGPSLHDLDNELLKTTEKVVNF